MTVRKLWLILQWNFTTLQRMMQIDHQMLSNRRELGSAVASVVLVSAPGRLATLNSNCSFSHSFMFYSLAISPILN